MTENRKHPKKNKSITVVLLLILLLTLSFSYLNINKLMRSPFIHEIPLDEPIAAVENEIGNTAVLDSIGTRIFVLSPEDTVLATVSFNAFSSVTPAAADYLAMDDENLYVLDHTVSENGSALTGERILVYDLNGSYKKTLITSEDLADEEHSYRIANLYSCCGNVYATLWDEMDFSAAVVGDITAGALNIVHHFILGDEQEVYDVFYQPETDSTTAVSQQGAVYLWHGETETVWNLKNAEYLIDDVYPLNENALIALDRNAHTIACYDRSSQCTPLSETAARSFFLHGSRLLYTDPQTYTMTRLDMADGTSEEYSSLSFSEKEIAMGYLTWGAALLGTIALILLLAISLQAFISTRMKRKDMKTPRFDMQNNALTTFCLYRPIFFCVFLGFVATAIIMGSTYFSESVRKNKNTVINTAIILRDSASDSFGDALGAVRSQRDYGSESYEKLQQIITSVCMSESVFDGAHHLSCTVYRFSDADDSVMIVSDPRDQNRIGTIMNREDQETEQIFKGIESVKEGYLYEQTTSYNNKTRYYEVYTPIRDSAGEIVGVAVPTINETYMASRVREALFIKLLEVFTMLAGLAVLFGEIQFTKEIVGIQHKRRKDGIRNTTVIEAHRPLMILAKLPGAVLASFITLFTASILDSAGNGDNPFLLALPLTIESVLFFSMRSFFAPICKYRPKLYMVSSGILTFVSIALLAAASATGQYVLLLTASVSAGVGTGMGLCSVNTIRFSGMEPAPHYRFMVFCSSESCIASAIGVSMAAVIRGIWGDLAMLVYLGLVPMVFIPAVLYFVGNDIAVIRAKNPPEKQGLSVTTPKTDLKTLFRFTTQPAVIVAFFIGLLPINFLVKFPSFVFPLLNEFYGLPSCMIGTVTLTIQLISLFVMAPILKKTSKFSEDLVYAIGLSVLTVMLILFGLNGTMKTFVPILVMIRIAAPVFVSVAEKITLREANATKVVAHDTIVLFEVFNSVADFIGPVLLTSIMATGISNLGWVWGGVCGVCLPIILLLRLIRRKRIDSSAII